MFSNNMNLQNNKINNKLTNFTINIINFNLVYVFFIVIKCFLEIKVIKQKIINKNTY